MTAVIELAGAGRRAPGDPAHLGAAARRWSVTPSAAARRISCRDGARSASGPGSWSTTGWSSWSPASGSKQFEPAGRRRRSVVLVAEDGRRLAPADRVVVLTGFRPDLSFLSEMRLELDPILQAPVRLAAEIDPNVHSCGSVPPHGAAELAHPEPGLYLVGMKSYGRAPTFLALTGYEQVRSVVAELTGDHEAAARVELTLPDTGVCGGAGPVRRPGRPTRRRLLRRPAQAQAQTRVPRRARRRIQPRSSSPWPDRRRGGDRSPIRRVARRRDRRGPRRVLVTLCVTQITSWGILYYAFPVLSGRISADTGLVGSDLGGGVLGRPGRLGAAGDRGGPVARPAWAAVADDPRVGVGGGCRGRARLGADGRLVRGRLGAGRGGDERGAVSAGVRRADPLVRRRGGSAP